MKEFQHALGSVTGKDHTACGINNQDGSYVYADKSCIIGVVSDGCSSSPHSEVGAKLASRFIVEKIWRNLPLFVSAPSDKFMEFMRSELLESFSGLADLMGRTNNSRSQTICDYFLFTVLGFVITEEKTVVFSIGDGVAALNGEIKKAKENSPTYLCYDLVNTTLDENPDTLKFRIFWDMPTESVQSILVSTDGAFDIIDNAEGKVPGKDGKIGGLEQFWETDFFFKNPDGLRRRLTVLNRTATQVQDGIKVAVEHGILRDDTTIIAVRRMK